MDIDMVGVGGGERWWKTLAYVSHLDRFLGDLPVHPTLDLGV